MGAKVAAGAEAGVGSAGKVHGLDLFDRVSDGVLQIIDFFGGDIEVFAVESAGFVRLDEVDDGIGDFVAECFVQIGKKVIESKLALVITVGTITLFLEHSPCLGSAGFVVDKTDRFFFFID